MEMGRLGDSGWEEDLLVPVPGSVQSVFKYTDLTVHSLVGEKKKPVSD